jgi:hypothetical protein
MPINPQSGETKEEFVSRCIGEEVSAGFDTPQAAAICYSYWDKNKMKSMKDTSAKVMAKVAYDTKFRGINLGQVLPDGDYEFEDPCWEGYEQYGTKIMDGREVPNCIPIGENMAEEGNINVFGINTEYFHMCPGAVALFGHLTSMEMDEDTKGMVRSAALIADRVFDIEEDVIEDRMADESDVMQATQLVSDFKDLMKEIDAIVGMEHDVAFMDGHIDVIKSYM